MVLVFTLLLTIIVLVFLIEPHFSGGAQSNAQSLRDATFENLEEQRVRCVQLLKDLELDSALRKISDDDYHQMRQALHSELAGVLARLDTVVARDSQV
jgi:hypothetical protein